MHKIVTGQVWKQAGGPIQKRRVSNILKAESRAGVVEMYRGGASVGEIVKIMQVSRTQIINILKGEYAQDSINKAA